MKLIVGLGNPGILYSGTRHNIGAAVVKEFARQYKISLKRQPKLESFCAKSLVNDIPVAIAIPATFMNLSGSAVAKTLEYYKVSLSDTLVVYDDLDLDLGRIRLRADGSAGGHNGVKSIIASINTQQFCRLRIGIGRPQDTQADICRYVLSGFTRKQKCLVGESISLSLDAILMWLEHGITKSMNSINR